MKDTQQTYDLYLSPPGPNRHIVRKEYNGVVSDFKAPATKSQVTKIYILTHPEDGFVYVGHTTQPMRQINARKHTPYNYKWLKVGTWERLQLHVFFPEVPADCPDGKLYGEAVEAEVVYLVRKETGNWPLGQNEIHFNNAHPKQARLEAQKIYRCLAGEDLSGG